MMKFLILTHYYPPENGAAQVRLASLSQQLNRLGHDVEVVCPLPNYPTGKIFPGYPKFYHHEIETRWEHRHEVHRYWLFSSMGKGSGRLLSYLSFTMTSFLCLFKIQKPTIIFVNSGPLFLGIPGIILSRIFNVPLIFNVSDIWPRSVEKIGTGKIFHFLLKAAKKLEHWTYAHSTIVNGVTEGVCDYLVGEAGIAKSKVFFLPNGVDLSFFQQTSDRDKKNTQLREKLRLTDKFVFIYSGNHGYAHALETILETAKILQNQGHQRFHFLFIGGGSEKTKLIELKQKYELENVTFLDSVPMETLTDYLFMADCGLIHLRDTELANETRPAKMFPMMAAQKPIIYCGWGEGRNLLPHQAELFCPPEKPEVIAEKISHLPDDSMMRQFGKQNFEIVRSQYSVEKIIESWLKHVQGNLKSS